MAGLGDISLNGNKYRVDIPSYLGKDMADFSPRTSVPGGSVVFSELLLYQSATLTDWRHGFGFHWFEDAMGYMSSNGNIDTRQGGLAMLYTKAITSDVDNHNKRGMCRFKSANYSWGPNGIRKYDGKTLTGYSGNNSDSSIMLNGFTGAGGTEDTGASGGLANIGNVSNVQYYQAQTLTIGTNGGAAGYLGSLKVTFGANTGTPTGTMNYAVYTDLAGVPSTLLASGTFTPTASAENTITVSAVGKEIVLGSIYWITLIPTTTQTNNNYWTVVVKTTDTYAGGNRSYSATGSTWTPVAASDIACKLISTAVTVKSKIRQPFSLENTATVHSIGLGLAKIGSPSGTLTATIQEVVDGAPSGADLASGIVSAATYQNAAPLSLPVTAGAINIASRPTGKTFTNIDGFATTRAAARNGSGLNAAGDGGVTSTDTFYVETSYDAGEPTYKYKSRRAFMQFDTSSIPDDAVITAASLQLTVKTFSVATAASFGVRLQTSNPISTVGLTNEQIYDAALTGTLDTMVIAKGASSSDEAVITKSVSLANINKLGCTYYSLINQQDTDNIAITTVNKCFFYGTGEGAKAPILTITYEVPPATPINTVGSLINFPLSADVVLTAAVPYCVILTTSDAQSQVNYTTLLVDNSTPTFSFGYISTYTPSAWTEATSVANFYIYSIDGGSTSWVDEYAGDVNYMLNTKDYVFYCPNGGRLKKIDTYGAHSVAGVGTNSSDYKKMIVYNGYVYAFVEDTNRIHSSALDDLSDLEGASTDVNKVTCGTSIPILDMIVYASKLYIAKSDGLWQMGDDKICRKVLDFSAEASSTNFASLAIHNGYLVFSIRDKIIQWNGSRISYITPQKITDTFPYTTYGLFSNFVVMGDMLYMTARTNETSYKEALLCFDGVGWHKLSDIITDGAGTVSMMWYEATDNRLWYHYNQTNNQTFYIPFQNQSSFPYPLFPTSGTNNLETSRLDMGYRRVIKSSPSVLVEASGLSATHQYLTVSYSIDGASYVTLGNITANGVTELNFSGSPATVEYYYIQLKVDFITDDATKSPVLESITLRFLMRPDEFYGYNMNIVADTNGEYGDQSDMRTAAQIKTALRAARASKTPVLFVDLHGESTYVYITSVREQAIERHQNDTESSMNIEMVINLNLTQVA